MATSRAARGTPSHVGIPRGIALAALVIGAFGSLGIVLRVGRFNPSHVLIATFVVWVLSPFVALLLVDLDLKRWPMLTRARLDGLMVVVAVVSLAVYAWVLASPPAKPAAPFLIVPLALWLVILAVTMVGRRRSVS